MGTKVKIEQLDSGYTLSVSGKTYAGCSTFGDVVNELRKVFDVPTRLLPSERFITTEEVEDSVLEAQDFLSQHGENLFPKPEPEPQPFEPEPSALRQGQDEGLEQQQEAQVGEANEGTKQEAQVDASGENDDPESLFEGAPKWTEEIYLYLGGFEETTFTCTNSELVKKTGCPMGSLHKSLAWLVQTGLIERKLPGKNGGDPQFTIL